jgi:hypothetical protein
MRTRYTQRYNLETKRFEVLDLLTQEGIGDYKNITAATHAAWALNIKAREESEAK